MYIKQAHNNIIYHNIISMTSIPHSHMSAIIRKYIKEITAENHHSWGGKGTPLRVSKKALLILHTEAENMLKETFEKAERVRKVTGKRTLTTKMMLLNDAPTLHHCA